MKKFFLLTTLLSVIFLVKAQNYITENRNLIKVIKTQNLSKEGQFTIVLIKDTIGVGDFDSIPIPSEYLKIAVEEGYVEYTDTIIKEPKDFLLGKLFFKEIVQRTQIITRDGDSDDFEVDKVFTVIKKDWDEVSLFVAVNFAFIIIILIFGRFSKYRKASL